jgi:hypothetical protein
VILSESTSSQRGKALLEKAALGRRTSELEGATIRNTRCASAAVSIGGL